MKQNIHLYIGDNASGKTRVLKDIIKKSKDDNKAVVTNIIPYNIEYVIDKEKKEYLRYTNNALLDKLVFDDNIQTLYEASVVKLLKLLYSKGDILVIDDLDAELIMQDILYFSIALADIRSKWDEIHVVGHTYEILRMFTDTDYEDYTESTEYNIYYVDKMNVKHISEEETYEYLDEIRG